MHRACLSNFHVYVIFSVAGFRPGRRGPFVPAKGPKTSDAPSGQMLWDGRLPTGAGQLAALKQGPPVDEGVLPSARRQASDHERSTFQRLT